MSQIHVEETHVIDARPQDVYAVLRNYHTDHPAIVPKPYFQEVKVEHGGEGAGTVILVRMKVMGVERVFRMEVTEPEPGRVLVETDHVAGVVTTFTVDGLNEGKQSRVTIASDSRPSAGLAGWMEKRISPPITRRIYKKELQQLADYVRSRQQ